MAKTIKKTVRSRTLLPTGLTVEQEAYCRCRASGMSIDESVLASGNTISVATAKGWERITRGHKRIKERIAELADIAQKNAILKTGLTREWVISRLMQVAERCMQAEPVTKMVGGELVETGEYRFDASGANTALKLLGDTIGLFKPVEEKPGDEFNHLSTEELKLIVMEQAKQLGISIDSGAVIDVNNDK